MQFNRFNFVMTSALLLVCGSSSISLAIAQTENTKAPEAVTGTNQQVATDLGADFSINLESIFDGSETPSSVHLLPMQEHFVKLVDKVRPATVGIIANGASGSGVIISRDGFVLTAAHVIGMPDINATIILQDGTQLKARTLGMDHTIDSGLLKITEEGKWPYLDMGESEFLNEGQWVMATGHPGGFDGDRAPPIRIGRIILNQSTVLQTDCTLVGGDSGGPLVDMNGDVIGIHSRIGGFLNQNYHVPIDTYLVNWDDLVAKVVVGGGFSTPLPVRIGFSFENDDSLTIVEVSDEGPAEKAGIQIGDELLSLNGNRIRNQRVFRRELSKFKPADKVKVIVQRGTEELEFEVTLDGR